MLSGEPGWLEFGPVPVGRHRSRVLAVGLVGPALLGRRVAQCLRQYPRGRLFRRRSGDWEVWFSTASYVRTTLRISHMPHSVTSTLPVHTATGGTAPDLACDTPNIKSG